MDAEKKMSTSIEEKKKIPAALLEAAHDASSVAAGDVDNLQQLGYSPVLRRNRSMWTLLFQAVAIAAPPFGIGGPLLNAVYGGGQLSLFIGWIVVAVLAQCVALSISELASRYPTSAGPYYWSYQLASSYKTALSFITGWTWLIGNWSSTTSVNFGFASLIASAITMYNPDWVGSPWQILLIFFGILLITLIVCTLFDRWLPALDTFCAAWTSMTIIVILVALLVKAKRGRHDASYAFTNYDKSFSGWGEFTFFIGLLPSAYTFSAVGMISSMAEQTAQPAVKVPRAISLAVPVEFISGLLFILPICFTMPPLEELITAPYGQALPTLFRSVMGSDAGAFGLLFLVLVLTMCCSFSITTASSRVTWAFARDNAIPLSRLWYRIDERTGVPVYAFVLVNIIQVLLGLVYLGSPLAFTAFVSVGVMALSVSYAIPVVISLFHGRREVDSARFTCGHALGTFVNLVAICWIAFEVVLFSMPMVLPVTLSSMNYASVVLVGFATISAAWYFIHARKVYKGPPDSDGIGY